MHDIIGGRLFVLVASRPSGQEPKLYAFSDDGRRLWDAPVPFRSGSSISPVISPGAFGVRGDKLIACTVTFPTTGACAIYNPATGERLSDVDRELRQTSLPINDVVLYPSGGFTVVGNGGSELSIGETLEALPTVEGRPLFWLTFDSVGHLVSRRRLAWNGNALGGDYHPNVTSDVDGSLFIMASSGDPDRRVDGIELPSTGWVAKFGPSGTAQWATWVQTSAVFSLTLTGGRLVSHGHAVPGGPAFFVLNPRNGEVLRSRDLGTLPLAPSLSALGNAVVGVVEDSEAYAPADVRRDRLRDVVVNYSADEARVRWARAFGGRQSHVEALTLSTDGEDVYIVGQGAPGTITFAGGSIELDGSNELFLMKLRQ